MSEMDSLFPSKGDITVELLALRDEFFITSHRIGYYEGKVAEIYATFIEDLVLLLPTTIGEEFILELDESEKEVFLKMDGWPNRSSQNFPMSLAGL